MPIEKYALAPGISPTLEGHVRAVMPENKDPFSPAPRSLMIADGQTELMSVFRRPYGWYLLADNPVSLLPMVEALPDLPGDPLFNLIIEARLAFNPKLPHALAYFLKSMGIFESEGEQKDYRLMLHEAILNAVEHGSLQTGKPTKFNNGNEMADHYLNVQRLLSGPGGSRPVTVRCALTRGGISTWVEDTGPGFDYRKIQHDNTNRQAEDPAGDAMGLYLIANLARNVIFDQEGRRIRFDAQPNEQITFNRETGQLVLLSRKAIARYGRVLIVDDHPANRKVARTLLQNAGFFHLEEAESGEEALQKVSAFRPDLILLDVLMPGISGFDVCRELKKSEATAHIPILFLSGMTDTHARTEGYRLGAVDFVSKPFEREELITRTSVHIYNGMILHSLQSYAHRLKDELEKARRLQENLFPSRQFLQNTAEQHGLEIGSSFAPCEELAGDYWSVFNLDEEHIAVTSVDFTGHGVVPAMNTIRLHALFHEPGAHLENPLKMARHINTHLYKMLPPEQFATLFYGVLNTRTGKLDYVGCGAPSPFIIPKKKKEVPQELTCAGIPIGIMETGRLEVLPRQSALQPGDTLLLYSDALTEGLHTDGGRWHTKGLLRTLETIRGAENVNYAQELRDRFEKNLAPPLKDDLTLISIRLADSSRRKGRSPQKTA